MTPPAGSMTIQKAAKAMRTGPVRLFRQLRALGVLLPDNMPRQVYLEREWFIVKEGEWENPKTLERTPYTRAFITAKGFQEISRLTARQAARPPRTARRMAKVGQTNQQKQQWQPQCDLGWSDCVLGM